MQHYDIKSNLFSSQLVENISTKGGQSAADFGISDGMRVSDHISTAFSSARNLWTNFQRAKSLIPDHKTGVSETRNQWMIPFLGQLGFDLSHISSEMVDGQSYTISHRDNKLGGLPVHITGFKHHLDQNPGRERGNRQSPHVQMQEYLNHTEHLYGLISNGHQLRLLRNHHRLTGIQYLEFDLQRILEDNDLVTFTALFRLLHSSRFPAKPTADCLLEHYHLESVEEGHRIRNELKKAVQNALECLGNGFLIQKENSDLRESLNRNELTAHTYGHSLRKLIYRLLFLFVTEERQLLFFEDSDEDQRKLYRDHYSLARLRLMAERYYASSDRHYDLWEQLKFTFSFFEQEGLGKVLGLAPLGGDLFRPDSLACLQNCRLSNRCLLEAIEHLSRFEKDQKQKIRINYTRINVEEFGAVYESLLDQIPVINWDAPSMPFSYRGGDSRKTTGSYYTHDDLVKQLLKTALRPVLEKRLKNAENENHPIQLRKTKLAEAVLGIKVCDPACGSGHFLLGAARALAVELALIRADEGESTALYEGQAMRDVIEHCIYGVDLNPDAVELCRLVLWLEAHQAGRPLTFLNHKIKCGNSLVGHLQCESENARLTESSGQEDEVLLPVIPDGAFKPVTGDDKTVAKSLRQQNKEEREGMLRLDFAPNSMESGSRFLTHSYQQLDQLPTRSLQEVWEKERSYQQWENEPQLQKQRLLYDAWTYAFFQPYTLDQSLWVTQARLQQINEDRIDPNHPLLQRVRSEARKMAFFHWPLEFPDVFGREQDQRGFDVVLGNPPWERIKIQEKEFFASRIPEIANARNAAIRKRMIEELSSENPILQEFKWTLYRSKGLGRYLRNSSQYNLTSGGDINTYSIFSERIINLISNLGRAGTLIPTGIATDYTNRHFFRFLISGNRLISLFDFINNAGLFPDIHWSLKICLLTVNGSSSNMELKPKFGFYLSQPKELIDQLRIIETPSQELLDFNPNTHTCPLFRSIIDHEIIQGIYDRLPILIREAGQKNPFTAITHRMFDMSADSKAFKQNTLSTNEWRSHVFAMFNMSNHSSYFKFDSEQYQIDLQLDQEDLPLYEAKHIWLYNHRHSTYKLIKGKKPEHRLLEGQEQSSPNISIIPRYFVHSSAVKKRLGNILNSESKNRIVHDWLLGFRDVSCSTNQRTFVCSIFPYSAVSGKMPLIFLDQPLLLKLCFLGMVSSIPFDYVARQKVGSNSVSIFILKQLPIIPPEQFSPEDLQFIVPRVLELTYTAWDLKAFADDVWEEADPAMRKLITKRWKDNEAAIYREETDRPDWVTSKPEEFPFPPFRWDENYRHEIQCELDAYFGMKYGLNEEEMKYVLDPTLSQLTGKTQEERDSFPGETFRVLKQKEIKKHGEYRTAIRVMKAWHQKPWENESNSVKRSVRPTPMRNQQEARKIPPLMTYIIYRHQRHPAHAKKLGRVKMEKTLHLIESFAAVDLGRQPIQDEYGPADFRLLTQCEQKASDLGYFKAIEEPMENRKEGQFRTHYYKTVKFKEGLKEFEIQFQDHRPTIDHLLELTVPLNRRQTELIATVYATWNNLLMDDPYSITDEKIIRQSHNWSPTKREKFTLNEVGQALQWLQEHELEPNGKGKKVEK
ncbi:hypothetical protein KFE98_17165 [bacterium SCSIO 12741]|nr:hypothetical protein KFE98_17165 [bacterium SCSIO 12741]